MQNDSSSIDASASNSPKADVAGLKLNETSSPSATTPASLGKRGSATDINEIVTATAIEIVATASEIVSATKSLGDMLSFKKSEKKPKPKMLTSAQISDLFRRLDRDGNGELDLEEFLQVSKKLKLEATEEYMTGYAIYFSII
jgi:hypothetical protein